MSEIGYAKTRSGTHVAFRVVGQPGEVEFVVVAGAFFSLELLAEDRVTSRFLDGLAAMGRVAVFDKCGVGLSDPIVDWEVSAQQQWADDLIAVIDAAGFNKPIVVSWEPMGVARLAAAQHPRAFSGMALINPANSVDQLLELVATEGGEGPVVPASVEALAFPSRISDPDFQEWLTRAGRTGASPSLALRTWRHVLSYDAPLTPPDISVRTLVLHNVDSILPDTAIRDVVGSLDNATLVSVPGADVYPIAGDVGPLIAEIGRFVGVDEVLPAQRSIRALLFTDLVSSTPRAAAAGDAAWRALLDHHDQIVNTAITHLGGRVVKFIGDGALSVMPSASSAFDAAFELRRSLAPSELHIRAGVHVGDIDERGADISGIAVNVAARIMSHADASEVVASTAALQAAMGSRHEFESLGEHELKGITGTWTLHRVLKPADI